MPVSLIESMTYSPGTNGAVDAREAFVECDICSLNGEFAALGHSIASVDREIHDDLVDLTRVGADCAQGRARDHDEIDILANHTGQHLQVLGDGLVQVEHLRSQNLLAAEGEQLTRQGGGALGGIGNFLRWPTQPRIGPKTLEQKFGVSGDHH